MGVVGASGRAAVHSLARAGYHAWAVDLFGDRDLTRLVPTRTCPATAYPEGLVERACQFPPSPVVYTGGLENAPGVVEQLAEHHTLWGVPPEVLPRLRDPHRPPLPTPPEGLLRLPAVVPPGRPCPDCGRWLRKPYRSAGGRGIRPATPGEPARATHYFQEFVAGQSLSAVYVGERLFGLTEQLTGCPWLHARPFAYCGNLGPASVDAQAESALAEYGAALARRYGLQGPWGIDFMWDGCQVVPVEVNPRYTAGVEVLEHARGRAVWDGPGVALTPERTGSVVGKAIYYAPRPLVFPATGPWEVDLDGEFDPWRLPDFADIPAPGTAFAPGEPVLTLLTRGRTLAECRRRLQSRAAELDRLFGGTHS